MNSYTIYSDSKYWWERESFVNQIYSFLKKNGCNVNIKEKIDFKNLPKCTVRHLVSDIVIYNNSDDKFFTISHEDKHDKFSKFLVSNPQCICVLKCQYRENCEKYTKYNNKISPFTYSVKYPNLYFKATKYLFGIPKSTNLLFFKGHEHKKNRELLLKKLSDIKVINEDYGTRVDPRPKSTRTPLEYLKRMASSKLALSLPGHGNACHREIEAFGLGIPVLMPILKNRYYDDLIPNVHYIAIDYYYDHESDNITNEQADKYCQAIKQKYEQVINDNNLLETISSNALNWFYKNINTTSPAKLVNEILFKKYNYNLIR